MGQAKPLEAYTDRVTRGELARDDSQAAGAEALQQLYDAMLSPNVTAKRGLFGALSASRPSMAGLYLWGAVGRGKSLLMDIFADSIKTICPTRRVHFHAFMLDVHKRLHAFRQLNTTDDLMPRVIEQIASEVRVLCLDEMQVTDVTDAMILSRLFSGLFDAGVVVVFTSNRPPQELYQGGLQREQFVKFIDLVKDRMRVIEIKSPTDYRLKQFQSIRRTFMYPRDGEADDFLLDSWRTMVGNAPSEPLKLEIQGRTLRVDKHAHGVAWLTFGELCIRPLGANDYLTLAKVCHTLLLQGIPKLSPEYRNEAKRFVILIDALYDHKVKLLATAAAAPEDIYPKGDGSFEFERTASRLIEMQSEKYLSLPHIS